MRAHEKQFPISNKIMKHCVRSLAIVVLGLVLAPALWAQNSAAPASTQPDGKKYFDYIYRVSRIEELAGQCDVMFIGDSITMGFLSSPVWKKYYTDRRALNYGVPSDQTQNVLFRLNYDGLKKINPKVVVILIGINNVADTAPDIAAGVHAVIDKVFSLFPSTKIILLDILPSSRQPQKFAAANELISKFSDERTVFRLNLAEQMVPVGDSWKGLGPDRVHLTEEGYQIWAERMEPLLVRLLAKDKP